MRKYAIISIGMICSTISSTGDAAVSWGGWTQQTQANAVVFTPDIGGNGAYQDLVHSNLPTPLTLVHNAYAQLAAGDGTAENQVDSRFEFPNPETLTLEMTESWRLTNSPGNLSLTGGTTRLYYSFTIDESYSFALTYDISGSTNDNYGAGFLGLGDQMGLPTVFFRTPGANESGFNSGIIGPGDYMLTIESSHSAHSEFHDVKDVTGTGSARYSFALTVVRGAVPEPASWTMMLGGFLALGGVMRRRGKAAIAFA